MTSTLALGDATLGKGPSLGVIDGKAVTADVYGRQLQTPSLDMGRNEKQERQTTRDMDAHQPSGGNCPAAT